MHFRRLIGELCFLSPLSIDDAEKYAKWINDFEVIQYLPIAQSIIGTEKEEEILENMSLGDQPAFSIIDLETDKLIGSCSLASINTANRTANAGIMIGDKNFWGRGYGTDAFKLLLDFGFNILNLENIILEVASFNERAISCFEKCGFKQIGIRRNAVAMGGKKYDLVLMDIIPNDFVSPYIKGIIEKYSGSKGSDNNLQILL